MHNHLSRRVSVLRWIVVLAGIVVCQFIWYAPSLVGSKILLPLDVLASKTTYLPRTDSWQHVIPRNIVQSDEVIAIEFRRRFAAEQVRAGRLPLWNPSNYCGAPFLAANNTAVFSPLRLPDYLFPGPETLAWVQMLKALVAGSGAYTFFWHALRVRFWPAALGAWCYPLSWFFLLWRGYPPSFVVVWLPWLLLATDRAVRRPKGFGGPALAVVTAIIMVSGQAASAAHVLLASGFYFLWRMWTVYGWRELFSRMAVASVLATASGWLLGFALSAPQNLPTREYLEWSRRIAARQTGAEQQLVVNAEGWPQLVFPFFQGPPHSNDGYLLAGNAAEGAPSGYAGLVVALILAPLAFLSRRSRWEAAFWAAIGIFSVAFLFGIPGLSQVFALPPLNLLKNNRLVFLTGWSLLVLAVIGADVLWQRRRLHPRWWFLLPPGALLVLAAVCVYRYFQPPLILAHELTRVEEPAELHAWFRQMYLYTALACAAAAALWALLAWKPTSSFRKLIAPLALGELLWVGYGVSVQSDSELYYPRLDVLAQLAQRVETEPGRVCGVACLPPNLNQRYGLADIRGYDGTDPGHLIALLEICESRTPPDQRLLKPRYAVTMYFTPIESPILDMLNLRYRIYRGDPPPSAQPLFAADDYWVEESATFLPRAFVPRRVESCATYQQAVQRVAEPTFDPRRVAYVVAGRDLGIERADGEARIVRDDPQEVIVETDMQTPGLLVLADLLLPGWKAFVDGRQQLIYLTNVALRGVPVPAGKSRVVFRYEPESFARGVRWFQYASAATILWVAAVVLLPAQARKNNGAATAS